MDINPYLSPQSSDDRSPDENRRTRSILFLLVVACLLCTIPPTVFAGGTMLVLWRIGLWTNTYFTVTFISGLNDRLLSIAVVMLFAAVPGFLMALIAGTLVVSRRWWLAIPGAGVCFLLALAAWGLAGFNPGIVVEMEQSNPNDFSPLRPLLAAGLPAGLAGVGYTWYVLRFLRRLAFRPAYRESAKPTAAHTT